ncbi:hypothetical protein [Parvibaculum sp.]|uniref:hypothetical protein n=1 Tax=Parvibaculum sp. TaxID=2024848 RepID=UPI0034A00AB4
MRIPLNEDGDPPDESRYRPLIEKVRQFFVAIAGLLDKSFHLNDGILRVEKHDGKP